MSMSKGDLVNVAGLDRFGSYDFAVPQGWLDRNPDQHGHCLWFYRRESHRPGYLMGRPLSFRAIARLAIRTMRKAADPFYHTYALVWSVAYPGCPLDETGRRLVAAKCDELGMTLHDRAYIVRYLYDTLEIPGPYLPDGWALALKPAA